MSLSGFSVAIRRRVGAVGEGDGDVRRAVDDVQRGQHGAVGVDDDPRAAALLLPPATVSRVAMRTSDGAIAACASVPSAGAAASASACFSMPRRTLASTSRCVRTGGPGGRVTAYVLTSATRTASATRPHHARRGTRAARSRTRCHRSGGGGSGSGSGASRRSLAPGATAVSIAGGAVTRATFSTVRFLRPERQGLSSLHRIRRSGDVDGARGVDNAYADRRVPAERAPRRAAGAPSRPPRPPCARGARGRPRPAGRDASHPQRPRRASTRSSTRRHRAAARRAALGGRSPRGGAATPRSSRTSSTRSSTTSARRLTGIDEAVTGLRARLHLDATAATDVVDETLGSSRYAAALVLLDAVVARPPFTDDAERARHGRAHRAAQGGRARA